MFDLPPKLKWLEESSEGRDWLRQLPAHVEACAERWALRLEAPYKESQVSIVLPVTAVDRSSAVLKVQFPHPESEHEAEALRRWNGQGAVQLFDYDPSHHALLMERCEPGHPLSRMDAAGALDVFAELLPRLWIHADKPFRSLYAESVGWAKQLPSSWERAGRPFEAELLDASLAALVIDPKPLVGEREFSLASIIRAYEFRHSRKCVVPGWTS